MGINLIKLLVSTMIPWVVGYSIVLIAIKPLIPSLNNNAAIGYGFYFGFFVLFFLLKYAQIELVLDLMVVLFIISIFVEVRKKFKLIALNEMEVKIKSSFLFYIIGAYAISLFVSIIFEIVQLPLISWDSWASYLVRSRIWFEESEKILFISPKHWGNMGMPQGTYVHDSVYLSDFIPLITYWMSYIIGDWDESLMMVPWLFCHLAMLIAVHGELKAGSLNNRVFLIFLLMILMVPILNNHIMLSGYPDIWITNIVGLTIVSVYIFKKKNEIGRLLLSLVMVLMCCFIKNKSGMIWGGGVVIAISSIYFFKLRYALCMTIIAIISMYIIFHVCFDNKLYNLDEVVFKLNADQIYIKNVLNYKIVFNPSGINVIIENMFKYSSWGLLWLSFIATYMIYLINPIKSAAPILIFILFGLSVNFVAYIVTNSAGNLAGAVVNRSLMPLSIPVVLFISLAVNNAYDGCRDECSAE